MMRRGEGWRSGRRQLLLAAVLRGWATRAFGWTFLDATVGAWSSCLVAEGLSRCGLGRTANFWWWHGERTGRLGAR